VRGRIRGFFEELLEEELTAALGRARPSGCRATPANQLRANRLLGMCCCRAEGLADCAQHGRGETKIDDAPGRYGLIQKKLCLCRMPPSPFLEASHPGARPYSCWKP